MVRIQAPQPFSIAHRFPLLRGFFSKHKQALRRPVERKSAFLLWKMIIMIATMPLELEIAVLCFDDIVIRTQENL